ncbi:MAG: ATP-binding protein [Verrucomicrobiota bacterium]|jgi:PAS domain S-box-containing protein
MPQPRILVIEDETIVAMDLQRGLKGMGCDVVATAGTGPEAIELAGQHRPDLVLMDIGLQGPMDGIEAGHEIRRRFQLPILFLTARADESTVRRAKAAEPLGYLLKPFDDRELHTAIEIALHKRKAEARAAREAGEALWQSEQRFDLLVESLSDYAVILLDPQGRIVSWNPGAKRITGFGPEEVIGQHCSLFYRPEELVANRPDRLLWTAAHQGRAAEEGWSVRKDGSQFWADTVVSVLRDQQGELAGFARITRDVTERKEAEEEIRKLNASLEHRVRERTVELSAANRELQAFTYSVAHDLRGPLRGIRAYLCIVQEMRARLPAEAAEFLDRSGQCAEQMSRLIDDLLKLGQVGQRALQRQPTSLDQLVAEVVGELEPESRNRQVQWRIEPLPTVPADPGLLRQVLVNLLDNALKYTRRQSRAVIQVGQAQIEGELAVFIRDNGVGFDMKRANKLFQPFSRLHQRQEFEGSGVGLAIVERIIGKHGGRVWAEAQEGHGATFYFTLGGGRGAAGTLEHPNRKSTGQEASN